MPDRITVNYGTALRDLGNLLWIVGMYANPFASPPRSDKYDYELYTGGNKAQGKCKDYVQKEYAVYDKNTGRHVGWHYED